MINSKRKFTVAYLQGNMVCYNSDLSLKDILDNQADFEMIFSIRENIDDILDLKIGERFMMNFNRDIEDSKGFIKRIS